MNFQTFNSYKMNYLKKAIYFGLLFAHFITAIYWLKGKVWLRFANENYEVACVPVFRNCFELAFENLFYVQSIFYIYALFCVIGLFLVLFDKTKIYMLIFYSLTFFKVLVLLSRYNFMGNYHTMHLSLSILTILSLGSFHFYRLGLILQYVFAGLLKLNIEWLSGAALVSYSTYMLSGFWHTLSLAYVPVLELILIWGLLSQNVLLRRVTLLQLIIFHLYSVLIVGFYYPLIMMGLLLPIVINEFTNDDSGLLKYSFTTLNDLQFGNSNFRRRASIFFIMLMIVWNISSKFYGIDPSMDGNIRYETLNMLDSKLKCQHTLLEEKSDGSIVALNIPKIVNFLRIHCDAIVYDTFLQRLCQKNPNSKFLFYLESARTTDKEYTLVRTYNNVCKEL